MLLAIVTLLSIIFWALYAGNVRGLRTRITGPSTLRGVVVLVGGMIVNFVACSGAAVMTPQGQAGFDQGAAQGQRAAGSIAAVATSTPAAPLSTAAAPPAEAPTAAPAATVTPRSTAVPTAPAAWAEIFRVQGSSIKNTESFQAPAEWRISWDTKPGKLGDGNFQIFIYKDPGGMVGGAANVIGVSKDSSIQRGAGKYYLGINSSQDYTIVVEGKQ